jgi:hypothetical protein
MRNREKEGHSMRMKAVSRIGAPAVIAFCVLLAAGSSAAATFDVKGSATLARIAGHAARFRVSLFFRMRLDDDGSYRLSLLEGACVASREVGGRVESRGVRVFDEVLARGVRAVIGSCFGRANQPDVHATVEGDTVIGTFSTRNRLPGVARPDGTPAFALWRGRFVGWRAD